MSVPLSGTLFQFFVPVVRFGVGSNCFMAALVVGRFEWVALHCVVGSYTCEVTT